MKIYEALMRKYRKFAITAAVVLALPWCAALTLDAFGTLMICSLMFIFFLASFILAAIRLIARKEIKYNLIIMGLSVLFAFSLMLPPMAANKGMNQLTAKRKEIMQTLQPVFIQYRQENGFYPSALEDLVPKYISEIPAELINDGHSDPYKKIRYELQDKDKAIFIFHTIRGPDSTAIYYIHEDTFWYEP